MALKRSSVRFRLAPPKSIEDQIRNQSVRALSSGITDRVIAGLRPAGVLSSSSTMRAGRPLSKKPLPPQNAPQPCRSKRQRGQSGDNGEREQHGSGDKRCYAQRNHRPDEKAQRADPAYFDALEAVVAPVSRISRLRILARVEGGGGARRRQDLWFAARRFRPLARRFLGGSCRIFSHILIHQAGRPRVYAAI